MHLSALERVRRHHHGRVVVNEDLRDVHGVLNQGSATETDGLLVTRGGQLVQDVAGALPDSSAQLVPSPSHAV